MTVSAQKTKQGELELLFLEKRSLHAQIVELGEQIHRLESIRRQQELHFRGLKAHLNTVTEDIKRIRSGRK